MLPPLATWYNPANVRIRGGTINGTVIGGTTPAAGTFTSVTTPIVTSGAASGIDFNTSGGTQFQVLHTASVTRNITITGSNGGNPTLSTTAGSLNITAPTRITLADTSLMFLISGTTMGARMYTSAAGSILEGVDSTGMASYQPFYFGGSTLNFTTSGVQQFAVTHTAGATRFPTITGSNGGNPVITVTGGELAVGTNSWTFGTANAVSPTAPNRTLTVTIGGSTYYIHAKTTND